MHGTILDLAWGRTKLEIENKGNVTLVMEVAPAEKEMEVGQRGSGLASRAVVDVKTQPAASLEPAESSAPSLSGNDGRGRRS